MGELYFQPDEWLIIEDAYHPQRNLLHETIFALGNGYMGVRGTPEEGFSGGESIPGTFLPHISNTGDIRYDWCRVGFPTRVNAMVTCPNWVPITLRIDGMPFDPRQGSLQAYRRTLNMHEGTLTRELTWEDPTGRITTMRSVRIACQHAPHVGAIQYSVTPVNYSGTLTIDCGIDAAVAKSSVVTEMSPIATDGVIQCTETTETKYQVVMALRTSVEVDGVPVAANGTTNATDTYAGHVITVQATPGKTYTVSKYVAVTSSRDLEEDAPRARALTLVEQAKAEGFAALLAQHIEGWTRVWEEKDIVISHDPRAQQGIRFSIFNMEWNYGGNDPRLNIGAKGISGPGYGGLYFWDSEVYLLPYYAYTDPPKARNLLMQRYITLPQARDRAQLFGFAGAMYPFVTYDGTDCAIPWELGMLEQHINVAIPYAVRLYALSSGDDEFVREYGAEMVMETCRFWASRVTFNERKQQYVINTVTGPDEYAMVVNNNCYTNAMTKYMLDYGLQLVASLQKTSPDAWRALVAKLSFNDQELERWQDVVKRLYIPFDRKLGLHPQDDSFLDMDSVDVQAIPDNEKPLLAHWPWERIIRSQVLKQPDVVLLMFILNERYSEVVKRANYLYYEPKTIHDSSLSPCIHAIMAAELGFDEQAFDYYLRSSRLDLDNVNGNAGEGVHIACMAGTWMSIVSGFAGMRMVNGRLQFRPHLPAAWEMLRFSMHFRGRFLRVELTKDRMTFTVDGKALMVTINGGHVRLAANTTTAVTLHEAVTV